MWDGRIKLVREKGLAAIVDANMERWFTKGFRERSPETIARIREMFLATNVEGYIGCGEAIRDMDHRPLLAKIKAPTLVIAGRHDPATTLEAGEFIAQHMPNAELAVLETAHIANMEQPKAYADTVLGFLLYIAWVERRAKTQEGSSTRSCHSRISLRSIRATFPLIRRRSRNSCGVVPVCLRKKRAKCEGSENASSSAMSWIGWVVKTSWRLASVSTR